MGTITKFPGKKRPRPSNKREREFWNAYQIHVRQVTNAFDTAAAQAVMLGIPRSEWLEMAEACFDYWTRMKEEDLTR